MSGSVRLTNGFPAYAQKVRDTAAKLVAETLEAGVTAIKAEAPVRTGNLRDGTQSEMTGDASGRIYNDTSYSGYVEFGTAHGPANPFFERGLELIGTDFEAKAAELLRG